MKACCILQKVTKDDEGDYTCYTENRYGKESASGELQVRSKYIIYGATEKLRELLTLLHSEGPKFHRVLALLSAKGLMFVCFL